jgi:hypothetical protein
LSTKMITAGVILVMVLVFSIPAFAQHVNTCPVGSSDQVGIAPHDYCNDTTFHNDRQYSPGDTTQTINDISPISAEQYLEQEDFISGSSDTQSDILNQGDNSIVCPTIQSNGSTGNIGDQQALEPLLSTYDDAELAGTTSEMYPTQSAVCAPSLNQYALNQ